MGSMEGNWGPLGNAAKGMDWDRGVASILLLSKGLQRRFCVGQFCVESSMWVEFSWPKSPQVWLTAAVGEVRVKLRIEMEKNAYLLYSWRLDW